MVDTAATCPRRPCNVRFRDEATQAGGKRQTIRKDGTQSVRPGDGRRRCPRAVYGQAITGFAPRGGMYVSAASCRRERLPWR